MSEKNDNKRRKGGRHPKGDRAIFRYSISLTLKENNKFLSLFEQSGMNVMAHFITACIFRSTVKTIKIDKGTTDYHMRLTTLYGQFRAVGVNYNQVVRLLYQNFSEKKAAACLYKLERQTAEMAILCRKIIELTQEFEAKHLINKHK
ncbi:conjugal transfer protein MobA [Flavobacterium sp. ST-75]|uniref:Conjugal transfer protein MobA n=1 Tax=Flavobacterium rhizophilum TaxID=3163296 RepID=A0ABW8YBQ0_9FLAO